MKKLLAIGLAALSMVPSAAAAGETRAIGVGDVVQFRRIVETRPAPDGRRAAMVVTEPSVDGNTVTSRILVTDGGDTRTVTTASGRIANLRWSPDGGSLDYLAPLDGADEIWRVSAAGGKPGKPVDFAGPAVEIGGKHEPFRLANVPPHQAKILAFEWSPDGRNLAFTTPRPGGRPVDDGVAFDDRAMDLRTLETGEYDLVKNGLWLFDARTGRTNHVVDSVMGPVAAPGKPGMAWSPDSGKLAFVTRETQQPTDNRDTLRLLETASGKVSTVDTGGARVLTAWSPDSRSVLAAKQDQLLAFPGGAVVATLPARSRISGSAWWLGDRVFAELADGRRESLFVAPQAGMLTPVSTVDGTLATCALGVAAFCVRESASTRPRLSLVDLKTGATREGFDPNPGFSRIRLTTPEPTATGYRLVPETCRRTRCPAVVITHGYDATERFMPDANEWQYPSQVFAAKGYVVLLVNETPGVQDPVPTMEAAVRDCEFADQARAGIMGYSRGAFVAEEAITRSTVFKAASAGDGGSPSLIEGSGQTAEHVNAPLLQQVGPAAGWLTLSIHQFVKSKNMPSELMLFGGETHIFHQPKHRASAMEQNLAWFDRWLRG
ncbi:hypothetical protein [Amycolatopsis sp. NPDC059657]|uniref:hypothetical protein n=1 Tax=Amycolatopsis sp. NPDC059657 TaxID=3346899 RepID=UPI00366ED941